MSNISIPSTRTPSIIENTSNLGRKHVNARSNGYSNSNVKKKIGLMPSPTTQLSQTEAGKKKAPGLEKKRDKWNSLVLNLDPKKSDEKKKSV